MRRVFMIVVSLLIVLGVGLTGTRVLANADNNPIFPTIEKVQQMIAEALGQPPVLPPFTSVVDGSGISPWGGGDTEYLIQISLDSRVGNSEEMAGIGEKTSWMQIHLPSGDRYGVGDVSFLESIIPASEMPPVGTPINVDVYAFFAGKTIHINTDITDWE